MAKKRYKHPFTVGHVVFKILHDHVEPVPRYRHVLFFFLYLFFFVFFIYDNEVQLDGIYI